MSDHDTLTRIVVDLTSPGRADFDRAADELETLCEAGDGQAQRVGAIVLYLSLLDGSLDWHGYVTRFGDLAGHAVRSGTVAELFSFSGDAVEAGRAHAVMVCALDVLADAGDDAASSALNEAGRVLSPNVLHAGRTLRTLPAASAQPLLGDWLDSLPPPTRWERLRWWASDQWWRLRFWIEDRTADARWKWWDLRDWLADKRRGG